MTVPFRVTDVVPIELAPPVVVVGFAVTPAELVVVFAVVPEVPPFPEVPLVPVVPEVPVDPEVPVGVSPLFDPDEAVDDELSAGHPSAWSEFSVALADARVFWSVDNWFWSVVNCSWDDLIDALFCAT